MKQIFKQVTKSTFNLKTYEPMLVGLGASQLMIHIIFPGLTVANTFINILSFILFIFLLIFIFQYLKFKSKGNEEIESPNQTEVEANDNSTIINEKPK